MKSSILSHIFKTPFSVAVFSILVSSVLSETFSAIFFGFHVQDFFLVLFMTVVIAGLVSYSAARGIIGLRLTVEVQKVKIALERERANILAKFIRDAAHEFKTPLSLMESSLYLLGRNTDPERKQHYSQQASEQIQILNNLLDCILVLTRLDSIDNADYPRAVISSQELLTHLHAVIASERIKLFVPNPTVLSFIKVNERDIQFVLKQLLGNALRFSPNTSDVKVSLNTSGSWLLLQITDQGEGMSAETLKHIFDRFYRADESHTTRGMGLGLSIVKRVTELHDGRIEVQSELAKGTTVQVYLPICAST